jgi:hypothetical protein
MNCNLCRLLSAGVSCMPWQITTRVCASHQHKPEPSTPVQPLRTLQLSAAWPLSCLGTRLAVQAYAVLAGPVTCNNHSCVCLVPQRLMLSITQSAAWHHMYMQPKLITARTNTFSLCDLTNNTISRWSSCKAARYCSKKCQTLGPAQAHLQEVVSSGRRMNRCKA